MSSFVLVGAFCVIVWTLHAALIHPPEEDETPAQNPQLERFLAMLERIRAYLSVWHVRPRA